MKRVCVIGNFGTWKTSPMDGQTVKTITLYEGLKSKYGEQEVGSFNTSGGIVAFLKLLLQSWLILFSYKNVIVLPAQRALPVVVPLLVIENLLFRRSLYYVVIGGWLSQFLIHKPILSFMLKRMRCICVETSILCQDLRKKGFLNVCVVPNGKSVNPLMEPHRLENKFSLRMVYLGRVNEQKGVEVAVHEVERINKEYASDKIALDIYGPIEDEEWFGNLKNDFPQYITYKGVVEPNQTVSVLKDYYAMLFPTKYYTEGIPGSIIDAYMAGIPVVSSRWESFADVVDEGVTGWGYKFDDCEDFSRVLKNCVENPDELLCMRNACLQKSSFYTVDNMLNCIELC